MDTGIQAGSATTAAQILGQIGSLQDRVIAVRKQLSVTADRAFGEIGSGETSDTTRDKRSGEFGSVFDALDQLSDMVGTLESEASRLYNVA